MSDQLFSNEPILDIMRFMTSIASLTIAAKELARLHTQLFIDHCRACRGSGRLTCPHCGGTASVRTRPAEASARRMALVTRAPTDVAVCARCGPSSPYDENPRHDDEVEGDPRFAFDIADNIKAALLGKKLLPKEMPILAGTIPCDECGGQPLVRRHTPNLSVLLPVEQSFQTDASLVAGDYWPQPGISAAMAEEEEDDFSRLHPLVAPPPRKGSRGPRRRNGEEGEQDEGRDVGDSENESKQPSRLSWPFVGSRAAARTRTTKVTRPHGEPPSRPATVDAHFRALLAAAGAGSRKLASRVRLPPGENDAPPSAAQEHDEEGSASGSGGGGRAEGRDRDRVGVDAACESYLQDVVGEGIVYGDAGGAGGEEDEAEEEKQQREQEEAARALEEDEEAAGRGRGGVRFGGEDDGGGGGGDDDDGGFGGY